ncbi:MAG TPA: Zn-dependent alcohol dehydrogenase [Acidimicrobiia bacterium]|nr:Zn-dependent alcohol dehydrogenase [Acidimicrobiia bacterium]
MTKAAVCKEVGAPLEVLDVDLDAPKAGEVRLQLGASGVCHSDLSVTNGTLPVPLPAVLGHEGAGTVTQVGDGVDHLEIGDHVVISWVPQCGACYFCKHDQGELCEVGTAASMSGGMLDMTTRFSIDGQPLNVMAASGTFSEETVVPAIGAVKISDDIPLTGAALIGCGVLTGFGAATNTASIRRGDTIAVIGCGGVGLNVIQGAKHAGAGRIIAIDMVDGKLATAVQFGATDTVNAGAGDPVAQVMELSGGRGADVAFEVIGLGPTIDQAFQMTRRGGQAIMVGVPGFDVTMQITPAMDLLVQEKQIRGCWYGSSNVHRDVPMLAQLYRDGVLKLDELISREITLDQVNDALANMGSGEIARSVIKYS